MNIEFFVENEVVVIDRPQAARARGLRASRAWRAVFSSPRRCVARSARRTGRAEPAGGARERSITIA